MPLSTGDQLGPYEILSPIGAGGMGEVYKARDTRLDRSVAVKVLPDHIANRDDARARFEREARAVASLNHPNICTLYDIGPNYMVMEMIEGETLAARIEKGPIPLNQAINLATQIADALDRAHRAGVTHRDVKPQNIMLTRDGVKVLDFGLAKSAPTGPGPTEATLTKALTTEGTVLGTPQYMAPEQFEGKEADARADIWAFGAVLYEMVTGQRAFQGKSYTSLVGAILSADPAPMAVKPFTPQWLERLVRRCLEKDPEDRYQSMRDIVLELRKPPAEAGATSAKPRRWPWAIAAASLLAAAAGWGLWLRNGAAPPPEIRFEIAVPPDRAIGRFVSLSPDGKTLAWADEANLYVRDIGGFEPRVLTQARVDSYIFWSPDSKQLGFRADGILKRIPVTGGAAQNICEARASLGVAWTKQDTLLIGNTISGGLLRVPASGGTPELVKTAGAPAETHRVTWPVLLPGEKKLLYVAQSLQRPPALMVAGLQPDGSLTSPRELLPGGFGASYMTDAVGQGRLLFLRGSSLMAQAFDPDSLQLSGVPQLIADPIGIHRTRAFFAAADGGAIAFRADQASGTRLEFAGRTGKGEPVRSVEGWPRSIALSPDGRAILADIASEGSNTGAIWILDPERGAHTRVTFDEAHLQYPIWSPDGKRIAYVSGGLRIKPVNGSGAPELLAPSVTTAWSWSHGGNHLLVGQMSRSGRPGLFLLSLDGDRKPAPFLESNFRYAQAQFSPDDRWVAYVSDESGEDEVYVRRFPDTGEQIRISNSGGETPRWSRDGRELFYIETRGARLMSVALRYGKMLEADAPAPLFESRLPRLTGGTSLYDVTPDGKRFLLVRDPESQGSNPLRVILNWRGETK